MSTIKAQKIQPPGDSDSLQIFTNAVERMNISSGGLVGIGITTPTSLLHVGGTATVSGNTTLNGTLNLAGAASLSSTLNVSGGVTLSSTLNVSGATTLTTATTGLITCATAPTAAGHLCNKTYVDGQAIGVGQTWQDFTSSRALGTAVAPGTGYLNSTGRTIMANVTCAYSTTGSSSQVRASVSSDGTTYVVVADSNDDGARRQTQSFLIPNGHRYRCHVLNGSPTLHSWVELR